MKKIAIFVVFLMLLSTFLVPQTVSDDPNQWIISGNKVYIDDSKVYLSATPHTLGSSGWVEFELRSKVYTGDIDLVWGFDTEVVKPKGLQLWKSYLHSNVSWVVEEISETQTLQGVVNYTNLGIENYDNYEVMLGNANNTYLYWLQFPTTARIVAFNSHQINGDNITITFNHPRQCQKWVNETYVDWYSITTPPEIVNFIYDGFNKWYLYKNIPISKDVDYKARIYLEIPFNKDGAEGKYGWAIKPSGLTISQALNLGAFYYLDPWWNASWAYFVPITIDSDFIKTPLLNFPVAVRVNASISALCDSGASVRFLDVDNTTVYYHEIEGSQENAAGGKNLWNATGENICWVNITSIPASSDFTFLMYFNNSGATSTSDPSNTFSYGYAAVYHFDTTFPGNPGMTVLKDSAGFKIGTNPNSNGFENSTTTMGYPELNVSVLGTGVYFNSSSIDYFMFGDVLNLGYPDYPGMTPGFTITGWATVGINLSSQEWGFVSKYSERAPYGTANERGYRLMNNLGVTTNTWRGYLKQPYFIDGVNMYYDSTLWNYYHFVHDPDANTVTPGIKVHFNGAYHQSITTASWDMANCSTYGWSGGETRSGLLIGNDNYASAQRLGNIDEVRIAWVTRNDSWIDAEYNSTNPYVNFCTFGGIYDGVIPREWQSVDNWTGSLYTTAEWQGNNLLYEWFSPDPNDNSVFIHDTLWRAQSITVGTTGENADFYLSNVSLKLSKIAGQNPGILFLRLYASDADHRPTGAILSQGIFDGNQLTATPTWVSFAMNHNMVAGTRYNLVLLGTTPAPAGTVFWSRNNNLSVPGSASYLGGFGLTSSTSGAAWTLLPETDHLFQIYGSSLAGENWIWSGALGNISAWRAINWTGGFTGVATWRESLNWTGSFYNWTKYQLTVTIEGNGFVVIYPNQRWYSEGDIVNLTAKPYARCAFDHWDGGLSGSDNPETVTFTLGGGDISVIANFSGSTFTYTDNETDIPSIGDVIDPNTGLFNWARIFVIAWYYVFGGWFIAIILGIIGGALWIYQRETPAVVVAYFIVILILYAAVTQSISYILSVILALIIGFLTYMLIKRYRE